MPLLRPGRSPAALAGLSLAVVLTGCAGTDSAAAPDGATVSTPTATATTSGGPASAAPTAAAEGQRIEVTVAGGQVTGDTGRIPVPAGEQLTLAVTSDVADEVHLHGYDLTADLTPGQPAELSFTASIPGVFEVELHEAGTVLLSLQVG
ncbi:cupredoxin domain-containing protein [Blastococcus deserti]|uniref:EfeO-type cupredoxin-like domain-containing protein n=1 Tax=Blastococcus deserti TaxID=2259033 RepID=A0ABW4XFK5_9ACTN